MALFGSKKNTEAKAEAPAKPAKKTAVKKPAKTEVAKAKGPRTAMTAPSYARVLIRPRVTEKAAYLAERTNAYTFEVASTATKKSVAAAVKEYYKVTPIRVNITNLPSKKVFTRGKLGMKSGIKKAQVVLAKGDKIEFV